MKILVTGSEGMLGHAIKEVFQGHELILTDIHNMDVRYWDDVFKYLSSSYDYIFHLAAETDLEFCEKNPELAYFANHTGTMNVARLASLCECPLVYISTAGVFSGNNEQGYSELDFEEPINVYGRSKLYGEFDSQEARTYTFRASWMYGGGPHIDKKFVSKIFHKIELGARELDVVDDCIGTPTYTYDLARTIKKTLESNLPPAIYHCGSINHANRWSVANYMVHQLGLQNHIKVNRIKSNEIKGEFPCIRSKNECLMNFSREEFSCMRTWEEGLKEDIEKEYRNELDKLNII